MTVPLQQWHPGDLTRTECNDLQGHRIWAVVRVDTVTGLHCGCVRLSTARPGTVDVDNVWRSRMDLLANRCGLHADRVPAAPEWVQAQAVAI